MSFELFHQSGELRGEQGGVLPSPTRHSLEVHGAKAPLRAALHQPKTGRVPHLPVFWWNVSDVNSTKCFLKRLQQKWSQIVQRGSQLHNSSFSPQDVLVPSFLTSAGGIKSQVNYGWHMFLSGPVFGRLKFSLVDDNWKTLHSHQQDSLSSWSP